MSSELMAVNCSPKRTQKISDIVPTLLVAGASFAPPVGTLIALRVFAKFGGTGGLGYLAAIQAFAAIVALVADANVGPVLVRRYQASDGRGRAEVIAGCRFISRVGGFLAIVTATLISPWLSPIILGGQRHGQALSIAAASGALVCIAQIELAVLTARQKPSLLAAMSLLQAVGTLTCALVLTQSGLEIHRQMELFVVGTGLAGFAAARVGTFVVCRHERKDFRIEIPSNLLVLVREGRTLCFATIAGSGAMASLPLVVRTVSGNEEAGLFRVGAFVGTAVSIGATAVASRIWFGSVGAVPAPLLLDLVKRRIVLTLLLAMPIAGLGAFYSDQLSRLVIGSTHASSAIAIRLVAELSRTVGLWISFSLLARAELRQYVILEFLGGFTIFTSCIIGSHLNGSSGASIGLLVSSLAYNLISWLLLKRFLER